MEQAPPVTATTISTLELGGSLSNADPDGIASSTQRGDDIDLEKEKV
jgi:hypothetical protein